MALTGRRERLRQLMTAAPVVSIASKDSGRKAVPEASPRPATMAAVEMMEGEVREWDAAFYRWTQARCSWREGAWGGIAALYINHVEHAHQHGGLFAPDVETFRAILMALGFTLSADGSMIYGLIFKSDAIAVKDHQRRKQ